MHVVLPLAPLAEHLWRCPPQLQPGQAGGEERPRAARGARGTGPAVREAPSAQVPRLEAPHARPCAQPQHVAQPAAGRARRLRRRPLLPHAQGGLVRDVAPRRAALRRLTPLVRRRPGRRRRAGHEGARVGRGGDLGRRRANQPAGGLHDAVGGAHPSQLSQSAAAAGRLGRRLAGVEASVAVADAPGCDHSRGDALDRRHRSLWTLRPGQSRRRWRLLCTGRTRV
mmetsp:Transcript_27155/g.87270  ORF Transcript_27155/g.87270 Transcript_27155/m.87270 type:complete len:226 (-) Transcript_27155:18-695(-)